MHAEAHSEKNAAITLRADLFPLVLRIGFWLCIVIAVAVVVRRLVTLAHPSQSAPPQMADLDTEFASHAALTLAHILPALAFVLLLPFTYFQRFDHAAWLQRMIFFLGSIGPHSLRHEFLFCRRMDRTLCCSFVQQPLPLFTFSRMDPFATQRDSIETAMVDTSHRHSSRYRNHTPSYGHLFCNQLDYASHSTTIFWARFLDRILYQYRCGRTLASFKERSLSSRKCGITSTPLRSDGD
jgi:hypothetical protein